MSDNLKVLIVDDSITYRQILSKVIAEIKIAEVMGVAPNGKLAIAKIRLAQPDIVFLDVSMPEMDGFETLAVLKKEFPNIDVVMVSGVSRENAEVTVKALQSGAIDFIPKPLGASADDSIAELKASITPLISLALTRKYSKQIKAVDLPKPKEIKEEKPFIKTIRDHIPFFKKETKEIKIEKEIIKKSERIVKRAEKIDVVAIGVSTGGPNALVELIPKIKKDFPLPILAVQHMPPMFTASLAERLNSLSQISVIEAKNDDLIKPGIMYIAPGGSHMIVKKNGNFKISLIDSPPVHSCRPAVDVLFNSIASVYGGNVLTVILTGMGTDGATGVSSIRTKGGYSIIQDEKTSVVWGMPGAVAEAGNADEILPLDVIADRITKIIEKGRV
ncbi:MAG: chemotaxis response regulator protein-glutamate methylesterase [Desulfobacterales bacterium]|nr:chemotaxis response regulator protein-glutamate methylesterase [Desulfobacterales bacterium]